MILLVEYTGSCAGVSAEYSQFSVSEKNNLRGVDKCTLKHYLCVNVNTTENKNVFF